MSITSREHAESTDNRVIEVIGNEGKVINGVKYAHANLISFEGKEYFVSHKAVLTINCTTNCNACCSFCYNGITFNAGGPFTSYNPDLKRVLDFAILGGIKTVAFSGGEPTLYPQNLYDLVAATASHFRESRLHTNGCGLFQPIKDKNGKTIPLIEGLVDLGLFGCSLSLAHYDKEQNAKIMKFRSQYNGLEDEQMAKLASLKSVGFSPRLSCFMSRDGIRNIDEIMKYIDFGVKHGFSRFIFRSGTNIPDEFAKESEYTKHNNESVINIDPMVESLVKDHGFTQSFALHKSDTHIHVLKKGNLTVDFDQSSEELDPDPKIRRLIYMPNHVTYSSWIDPSSLVFTADFEKIIAPTHNNLKKAERRHLTEEDPRIRHVSSQDKFPCDYHVHTINSDGKTDVTSIIRRAVDNGVKSVVITEHNFIADDYALTMEQAGRMGIEVPFPGVEISTVFHNEDNEPERFMHILGYGKKLCDKEFMNFIEEPLRCRLQYFRDLIGKIIDETGFDLPSVEDMMKGIREDESYAYPFKKMVTRTAISPYLAAKSGLSEQEVKSRYLPQISEQSIMPYYPDTIDVIKRIRDLGGVCGVAHPTWNRMCGKFEPDDKRLMEIVFQMKRAGLCGIESMNRKNERSRNLQFYNFGRDLGLIYVGGSDYHGKPDTDIGHYGILEKEAIRIKDLLAKNNNI